MGNEYESGLIHRDDGNQILRPSLQVYIIIKFNNSAHYTPNHAAQSRITNVPSSVLDPHMRKFLPSLDH